jgi:acetolactate synthase-1/2/3 large subunit
MVGNGKGLDEMDLPPHMRNNGPSGERDYGNLS